MDNIELVSKNGKIRAEIYSGAKEELAKSGIDVENEVQSIIQREEDKTMKRTNGNQVTRKEYNILNLIITSVLIATALLAWRINVRHQENIRNIASICDKIGIEYSISTNKIGISNSIILKQ